MKVTISSYTASFLSGGSLVVKRAVASVVSPAGLIVPLALLLIAVAACGDDDGGAQPAQETGSPTPSLQTTASPSPTDDVGGGNGSGTGQASPPPTSSGGGETPSPGAANSGTALIAGVRYDFTADSCTIGPDSVVVLGRGLASDGRPFIATASWYRVDIFGNQDAIDVGIHTNVSGLLDPTDQSFRMGSAVENSTVESIDIDVTGFDVTATGTFVDQKAPQDPPVKGSFTLSCS